MCSETLTVGTVADCGYRQDVRAAEAAVTSCESIAADIVELLATGQLSALERRDLRKKLGRANARLDNLRHEVVRLRNLLPAHDAETASVVQDGLAWWATHWHLVVSETTTDESVESGWRGLAGLSRNRLGYQPLTLEDAASIIAGRQTREALDYRDNHPVEQVPLEVMEGDYVVRQF